jgi:hypothetical protein
MVMLSQISSQKRNMNYSKNGEEIINFLHFPHLLLWKEPMNGLDIWLKQLASKNNLERTSFYYLSQD